jgi:hypothetical protein
VIYGGTREQVEKYAIPALRDGFYTFFAIPVRRIGQGPSEVHRMVVARSLFQ